jgi:predicted acylesterase/phospholipase RssA
MACRCSMAVPFLFQAVPTTEGDLLVDGGVLDNCPLDTFNEVPGVRNPKTLGWVILPPVTRPHSHMHCAHACLNAFRGAAIARRAFPGKRNAPTICTVKTSENRSDTQK